MYGVKKKKKKQKPKTPKQNPTKLRMIDYLTQSLELKIIPKAHFYNILFKLHERECQKPKTTYRL